MTEEKTLELSNVVVDNALNPRQGALDQIAVLEYAEHVDELPPMVVFRLLDDTYLLVAGFHRIAAHQLAGRDEARFVVRQGSRQEAEEFADLDNLKHGLQLTRAEKREVIRRQLKRHSEWSDVRLAKTCYTTDKTVRSVREEMEAASEIPRQDILEGADGIKRPRSVPRPAAPKTDEHTVPMEMPNPQGEGETVLQPTPENGPAESPLKTRVAPKLVGDPGPRPAPAPPPPPIPKKLDMATLAKEEETIRVVINIKPESQICMLSLGPEGQPPAVFKSVAYDELLAELGVLLAEHTTGDLRPSQGGAIDIEPVPEEVPEWLAA